MLTIQQSSLITLLKKFIISMNLFNIMSPKRIDVDEYFARFDPLMRELGKELRKIILNAVSDLDEVIKWRMPVYEKNGNVCSIAVHKDHVNLEFFRGIELKDPNQLLQGTGKKMRLFKIKSRDEIKVNSIKSLLNQAVKLNMP